jgi:hypothetical protein
MALPIWTGEAQEVADIWTVTVTGYDATTTYKVGANGKTVSVLGSAGGSVAGVATALATAWSASQEGEHQEFAATTDGTTGVLTLTMNESGRPGTTLSSSVTGGAGTIGAPAQTSTATGSRFWDNAANWSTGVVPANGDTVLVENANPILYGLNQSGVTLAKLILRGSGDIGLPPLNTLGYAEPREQYLRIGATLVEVDSSSQLIRLDHANVGTTHTVYATGASRVAGLPAMTVKGTLNTNKFYVFGSADFGLAARLGEASAFAELQTETGPDSGSPTVYLGPGVTTATAVNCFGGSVRSDSNLATVVCRGGVVTNTGATTVASMTVGEDSEWRVQSTGTATAVVVEGGGHVNCATDPRPRTFTNITLHKNARYSDPNRSVTHSNPIQFGAGAGLTNVTIDRGVGHTLTA